MFLNDEINNIKSLNNKNNFLENEIFINFINEFIKKPEIQNFFKFIIQDIINDINKKTNEKYMNENYYDSNNKINLDVMKIETIINKTIKEKEEEEEQKEREKEKKKIIRKTMESTKSSYSVLKETNNNDEDNFPEIKKYFDDITMSVLEKNSLSDKSSKNFKEFCSVQIQIMNDINKHNNMEIYSNQTILKNIYRTAISSKIFNVYQKNFSIVIDTINQLLKNIKDNLIIIPGSLKVICKAIVLLAKKRFGDNLNYVDSVFFFGQFFFNKILLSFLQFPENNYLLNNLLFITEETIYNLDFISFIINKFISGTLFLQSDDEGNLTPFNGYFMEKIPELYNIFDEIMSIDLPINLQKIIDSENLDNYNYEYNYFDEYKNDILNFQSCCLSFNDLLILLKTINDNKDFILKFETNDQFKNHYETLINDKENLNYILDKCLKNIELSSYFFNNKDKNSNDKKELSSLFKNNIEYFIINRILYNENTSNNNKYKNISILYINLNDVNEENNSIFLKKLKESLCQILYNIPYIEYMINKKFIKENSLNDLILFLSDIKIYQLFLSKHRLISQIQTLLPFEFAIDFLINNASNLPENYSNNNYQLFINEVKKEINDSIESLKSEKLFIFLNNFNLFEAKIEVLQKFLSKISKIPNYRKIKGIIGQTPVYIKIKVNHSNNNNFDNILIEIKQSISNAKKMKNLDIFTEPKRNLIIFKTIENLARNFSFENNIEFYLLDYLKHSEGRDIFNYIYKFQFNEKIRDFFGKDLKNMLTEQGILDNQEKSSINKIISKLYDYFLNYLYDSIYKYIPSIKDKEIYTKIKRLSWTKLSHFILENSNIYECLIQKIVDCFIRFEKLKTPSEKYFSFKEIIEISNNIPCKEIINFKYKSKNKEINLTLNPLILYGIIKAKPKTIVSDIKYILHFIQEKNKEIEEYFDYLLPSYLLYIKELNNNNLHGNVTKDEFTIKCNDKSLFE